MPSKTDTSIERIIAKIDNDFNPDNSDWIPRVGAWTYDVLSMLDCIKTEKKKIKIPIDGRFGIANCDLGCGDIKMTDKNGCKIELLDNSDRCNLNISSPSTGKGQCAQIEYEVTPSTIVHIDDNLTHPVSEAQFVNTKYPPRYNVVEHENGESTNDTTRGYYRIGRNKIELTFDTDAIYAEVDSVKTVEVNGCSMPVIPNNGTLIECIGYYCMYKMLCRGYKHPVMNLQASQYGTNPFYLYMQLKDKAKREVIAGNIDEDVDYGSLWNSSFYLNTFGGGYKADTSSASKSSCGCG